LLSSVHKDSRNLTTELLTLTANEAAHAAVNTGRQGNPTTRPTLGVLIFLDTDSL